MNKIELSEIQIIPIKPINGFLSVGDVAIYNAPGRPEGYRLVFPDKVLRTGKKINVVYPITQEAGRVITEAVVEKYNELQRNIFMSEDRSSEEVVRWQGKENTEDKK